MACREAEERQLLNAERRKGGAFTNEGFRRWRDGPKAFRDHENSRAHKAAVRGLMSASNEPKVLSMISDATRKQMKVARKGLTCVAEAVQFLAVQGLPFRRRQEDSGNFMQVLHLISNHEPELQQWLSQAGRSFTSHQVQDEILRLYAAALEEKLLKEIRSSDAFGIILDETADISRREQASFCFRFVDDDLIIHEAFLGMYELPDTKAATLHAVLKDVLTRCQLDIGKLRAQCYDGAANMSGSFNGKNI